MPAQDDIKLTFSVRNAADALSGETDVSSWDVVRSLLRNHAEYGGNRGEQLRAEGGPADAQRRPSSSRWVEEVGALFDPAMVRELHGRLLVLGLCHIDPVLQRFLRDREFLRPLSDELKEDFESLLLPAHAGDQAYRREFLKLLQNKPVDGSKPRSQGFVVLVEGGPGLRGLAELCHRQRWNQCFTARYVVGAGETLADVIGLLLEDLRALGKGTPVGDLLPDPATSADAWRERVEPSLQRTGNDMLSALGVDDSTRSFLEVGVRLVLFLEYRRVSRGAGQELERLFESAGGLARLPERVGIVISGFGVKESLGDVPDPFTVLRLPFDRELTRGQALANDVPAGPDRLNLLGEVNAIAEGIALEDMSPPMVVGVMGGWGAGKSFVLHLIENRIQEIRCEAVEPGDSGFPFVGHPYIIRFDAWTYAKGNLWASLMQQIFLELDRQIGLERVLVDELGKDLRAGQSTEIWRVLSRLSGEERERLLKTELGRRALDIVRRFDRGQIVKSRLWSVLEELKKGEIRELKQAERTLEQVRVDRDAARLELQRAVERQIENDARRSVWESVGDEFLKQAWQQWSAGGARGEGAGDPPTFAQLADTLAWYRKLMRVPATTLLALGLYAGAGVVVAVLGDLSAAAGGGLTAAFAAAGSLWTGLSQFRVWAARSRREFDEAVSARRRQGEEMRDELVENAIGMARSRQEAEAAQAREGASAQRRQGEEARDGQGAEAPRAGDTPLPRKVVPDPEILEKARSVAHAEDRFRERQVDVETRRQRVGMAARHLNLLDFVRQRLEGRVYEDKLGLLHQVKSDLEDLSDALLRENAKGTMFPRGKPRVMLFIDDLDRCPPDKVVEVLEAAQLLVKTPLFVVVIAMDVRYVARALEKVYAGVLTPMGEPSGLDYIEKIVQVPYRVRPVAESAVGSFLWSQMSPHAPAEDTPVPAHPAEEAVAGERTAFQRGESRRAPMPRPMQTELRVLPTETLRFSVDDHELISQCCAEFEVSPRTMKRLVNVFKLLKIIWYREGLDTGPDEEVKRAMLALLVIAARFPEPMRQLLHALERRYSDAAAKPEDPVVGFLLRYCAAYGKDALVRQPWADVEVALSNPSLISPELTFARLHERHLHLVSTFSFVGESDPARAVDLHADAPSLPASAQAAEA